MSPHRRAVAWAAGCSSVVLAVGGLLPLWERVAISSGDFASTANVPVWVGLTDYLRGPPRRPDWVRRDNRNTCVGLLTVAGIAGAFVYLVRRPRTRPLEAVDYVDGPKGSVRDGRAPEG